MGEWVTLSESNLNRLQTLVFASHEIKLTRGFGRGSKLMEFSREFKGSVVKETFEPGLYRVEISRDKNVYVYEFKLCPKEVCHSTSKEALTYSVIKNKELIRGHWTSINLVLFRPIGVE
ncbi:MAG TPA: hypothetical protein VJT09_07955 [Pyrinomonadaceae bacterium]|nr:hypothetical protein [Pyrinomonadaceae bacterium]